MADEPPVARLVLTTSYRRWHIAWPKTRYFALCGVRCSPPGIGERPTSADVCKRCRRIYDREVPNAD